ncbi:MULTISPECIES: alpha/beta hydrolase [unclassified Fusibacter]|uniref:alpha/beta hydrolase n=1 Tax=unclassified Fusibacter TaxID=2624464 RepID=UPI0010126D5F|nr:MULTISPECIES: alpha/beta hydrolase [unclassified Fusibacter]MCK8059172.1 alpha/beta hydrolase [Fusibacter sp. A2]NPE22581.1 carboxymethylenebutenolidase [Fusibacter sp. A1]RXV60682.1 carboxymethylenebutenolidase [Fusibacter sp. A1]
MRKFSSQSKAIKIVKSLLFGIILILILAIGGFYIYTLDYYRASEDVNELMQEAENRIEVLKNTTVIYPSKDNDAHTGIIFYPGGKVEAVAYLPLLKQLSDQGYTCVLVKMPMNLAVFDVNAADKIYGDFPQMERWYLAGHSLGGAMASSYMEDNSEKVDGLILLGAYPLNEKEENVLVVYGSEDIMLDLAKLETTEKVVEIVGGNHAYFGNYGEQEGDGTAVISRSEQQAIAVKEIAEFIK